MTKLAVPLFALVVDPDEATSSALSSALRDAGVQSVEQTASLKEAQAALQAGEFNTVFVDPISLGIEPASKYIFSVREALPEIVFVLYLNKSLSESKRSEFYRGERRRFAHYYSLDKATPVAAFAQEVSSSVFQCQADLRWRMSKQSLERLSRDADQREGSGNAADTGLAGMVREILETIRPSVHSQVVRNSVFLSYRFAEQDYVDGLTKLLEQAGFSVATGQSANTFISRAVLERIKTAEFFLCLMTRVAEKKDGAFTTSPWLLEEKGAAIALGKPIVLMVEEGVEDYGGLEGDWQRIHFGAKRFTSAALAAVEQLQSYAGEQ